MNAVGGSPNNGIYISSNYGQTWISTGQGIVTSTARAAMSASGQYILIASQAAANQLYSSSNYGLTWTRVGISTTWTSVAMSASGQYQLACPQENTKYCYYSFDYGQTWTASTSGPTNVFSFGLTMSASGQYACLSVSANPGIYYSSNYGQTWTIASGVTNTYNVCMSASGQYVIAVGATLGTNYIYYSVNYGISWTATSQFASGNWYGCAMSANGQYLLAVNASAINAVQSITRFPPQSITSQSTTTSTALNILAPSITAGQNVGIVLGQSIATNYYGTIGFQYVGIGSTATQNYIGIGVTTPTTLCITANNYVGIGTVAPATALDTVGIIRALNISTPTIASGSGLELGYSGGGSIISGTRSAGTLTTAALTYQASTHAFNISTTITNALFITSSGTVGINTNTTGAYTLNVTGSIYATGDITALSDKRQKQNIMPLEQSLNLLTQLTGYSYTRLNSNDKVHIGLIAQEVNEVFPQSVTYDDELGLYSLNYGCLIAPVIQAIKELKQTVDKLQEKSDRQDAIIQIFLDHFGPQQ
jgi:hypothetical protein